MNLLRFIPIKLTLFLVMGILLGRFWQPELLFQFIVTIAFLSLLGILFYRANTIRHFAQNGKGSTIFGVVMAVTTISIGTLAVCLADARNMPHHFSHKNLSDKQVWKIKIEEELKTTSYSHRYLAKILGVGDKNISGTVLLSISLGTEKSTLSKSMTGVSKDSSVLHLPDSANREDPKSGVAFIFKSVQPAKSAKRVAVANQKLQVDDEILVYAKINSIRPPLNPHQFDYKDYMRNLGVSHQMRISEDQFIKENNPDRTIYGIAAATRNHIIHQLKKSKFGEDELGIIQALLLGQRNDISPETYDNYKNAGAVHILAVSGLHIGVLLLLLQFLLRPLERFPNGKTLKLILIVGLLWSFAVLAGLSASVVRAVTMFSFVAYALYLNRPGNTFNILALSMFFILLLVDPLLLFQVGFQMSYTAVFAIVWIYPLLQRLWNPKNKIVRYFWQLLSVSIAAQAGVLPISLFYFHQFPGLFFISNLLIVPALGLILGAGILIIVLALANYLPEKLVTLYDTMIRWMNQIVGWVAQQEAFVFRNISFDGIQLFLAYGILLCLVLFLSKPNFKKAAALGFTVIGFQLWLFHASYRTQNKEMLFLAHQTRNSVLLHQKGNRLTAITQDTDRTKRMTTDYKVVERIASISQSSLKNSYRWGDEKILIIDSLGIYTPIGGRTDYLVLTGSPKLNLERLIDTVRPKVIIADGSNYRSYVKQWKKTCEEIQLPFHSTVEHGAFLFKNKAEL